MNWKYAALAIAAFMLIAPALTLAPSVKAQAPGQVTFNVLTAEVSPEGYVIVVINNTWIDEEYQLGAGVSGEIYIDFDQLERISDVAIPLLAPDNRTYAKYVEAIYNDTSGTGSVGVDPGRLPLTGVDQQYTVLVFQLPNKAYFENYTATTGNAVFGVPLYLKIWTGAKTIVSKGSFIVRNTDLKLQLTYNPSYTDLSFVGSLYPFLDGVFNIMEGTLQLTWGDGTPFNFTKYTSTGHYLEATLNMVNVDFPANDTHLLLYAFMNNTGTNITTLYNSDVLYHGSNNITVNVSTSTFYFKDRIGNFSVLYAPGKVVDKGKPLPYAEYQIQVDIDTNLDERPFVLYFDQPDRNVTWLIDTNTSRVYGIYINITNDEDAARGVYIDNKTIIFTESTATYGGDLLGFGNLTATAADPAYLAKGVMQLEWYKNTDEVAGVSGFAGNLVNNTYYVQFFYTLTATVNVAELKVYPSIEITARQDYPINGTIHINYAEEFNVGDEFNFTAHHLPANANISKVCLFQFDPDAGVLFDGIEPPFEISYRVLTYNNTTAYVVGPEGIVNGTVYLTPDKPFAGHFYYLVLKVNETIDDSIYQVRTWPASVGRIYPILYQKLIQPDGTFATDYIAGLGDYVYLIGVGFDLTGIDAANDIAIVFMTDAGDQIILTPLTSAADGLLIRKINDTAFEAIVRLPYENYLFTDLGSEFTAVFVAAVQDNPMYHKGSTGDLIVKTDGSEAKVFLFPVQTPVENYISWDGVTLPAAITGKYPYEAWETINQTSLTEAGYTEDEFKFYAEIIGAPYARLFIDVNLYFVGISTGFTAIALPETDTIAGAATNGYALAVFEVPTVPYDSYQVTLASATETFTTALNNNGEPLPISVDCITAVKAARSGKPEYYVVPGTYAERYDVHVLQDGQINVIGFGYGSGETVKISVYGALLIAVDAAADGTFNATFPAGLVLITTGTYTGIYEIDVKGQASGCTATFNAWIEEMPTLLLKLEADPVAFPGELVTVALKIMFQYSNIVRPVNISAPQDLYQIDFIKFTFIYYRGSVDDTARVVTKTFTYSDFREIVNEGYFTCMGMEVPAEYYPDIGLLVLRFPMVDYNKSVVIDVIGQVTFANGVVINQTDHKVVSLEDYLYGTLESINYDAIVGAITAEINTAKGEILASLEALYNLTSSGFDNVILKLDNLDGKVSDVLSQLALLQTFMAGNFSYIADLINAKAEEIMAALQNISVNVSAPAEINLTELYAYIDATAAALAQQILGAINASTAALQITIQATGDYVVQTLFGKIELSQQQLADLLASSQKVVLQAINDSQLALTAYLDAKALEVTGNMTNLTTMLAQEVMNDIAAALDTVKAQIDIAAGKVILRVSDIVDTATSTVLGEVYYYLFGEKPELAATAVVSVKDLIQQASDAVITTVNASTAKIEATIGDAKVEIVNSIQDSTNTITSAITSSTDKITSTVDSKISDATNTITSAINKQTDDLKNEIGAKANDLSTKIDNVSSKIDQLGQQQSQKVDQVNTNVNSVKTLAIIDAVLAIIAIILIVLVLNRLRTAG